ncbi:MAG: DUF4159 domain-containing protein [Longimicrobiales bacterium]|nr:DUF4159 domain-containing protein [Longimicrobiales bacterium]
MTARGIVGAAATLLTVGAATAVWAAAGLVPLATHPVVADPMTPVIVPTPGAPGAAPFAPPGYDGSYEFVRVQYGAGGGGGGGGFFRREPMWAHDHPRAERNFLAVLDEITLLAPRPDGYRVLRMDDPQIFNFPIIYLVEIGAWAPSEAEITALRAWLAKGGFLIVDDFRDGQIRNLFRIMSQVSPGLEVMEVPDDHPVFDSFFRIDEPRSMIPLYGPRSPEYLGIFEENDPTGRLMAIFNYNNDIAEYWEYSGTGYYPIDLSNEAFKFGVNYIVYAHTR